MSFPIQIAGAVRRFAYPLLTRAPRSWKLALVITMLLLPGGSLAALGFAWLEHRRQRAKGDERGADVPLWWRLASCRTPCAVR